jgi:uncharacterized delta-60 repeat protein
MPAFPRPHIDRLEPRTLCAAGDPLDAFGDGGVAATPVPLRVTFPSAIVPQRGGKLLVALSGQKGRGNPAIRKADFVRFDASGAPDPTFGGGTGSVDTFFDSVRAVAARSDGRFLAYGYVVDPGYRPGGGFRWFVARFTRDGKLDHTFREGRNGRSELDPNVLKKLPHQFVHLSVDGKVTIAGSRGDNLGNAADARLLRFTPDGRGDATFGIGGTVALQGPTMDAYRLGAARVADDGAVYVVDRFINRLLPAGTVFQGLRRFTPAGGSDAAFGENGVIRLDDAQNVGGVFNAGSDVLVNTSGGGQRLLLRFDARGGAVSAFGGDGAVELPSEDGFFNVRSVFPVAGGKLLVIDEDCDAIRLRRDGSRDAAFGETRLPGTVDVLGFDGNLYSTSERRVFATSLTGAGTAPPYRVENRTLIVEGTAGDDRIGFGPNGGLLLPVASRLVTRFEGWARRLDSTTFDRVRLDGGGGNDLVRNNGRTGTTLLGGIGDDTLEGGFADNLVDGGPGDDTIDFTGDAGTVLGGEGDDEIEAFANVPVPSDGPPGPPRLSTVRGGAGNDHIRTNGEDSIAFAIFGDAGDDLLVSEQTRDTLTGGPGRDTLVADAGEDTLVTDADDVITNR